MENERFERSRSLLGECAFESFSSMRVTIFGVGGVGGWCAEALLRTGIRCLTLVDDDVVAESNINRQRQALPSTVGQSKVEILRNTLLQISPVADIVAVSRRYTPETSDFFDPVLSNSDFVIDAIDSVDCKAHLIDRCLVGIGGRPIPVFSSMGAARRLDPTKIRHAPFHKIAGDGLAKALRNRFRKYGVALPRHLCVYSEESPNAMNRGIKGSVMPVTCAFGMALASLVIQAVQNAVLKTDSDPL